jgi:sporulation protein YlmC with PRC-barrel domain
MTTDNYERLVKLGAAGQTVADGDNDIRGRMAVDRDGVEIGKIDDLLIDAEERKVRYLEIETGGFLGIDEEKSFIPVGAITSITKHEVHIDQTGSSARSAPAYDPPLADEDLNY